MRTDELRELLERYPQLCRAEKRRLRDLYRSASATEIIAIMSSDELRRKATRLDKGNASAIEIMLIIAAAVILGAVLLAVAQAL